MYARDGRVILGVDTGVLWESAVSIFIRYGTQWKFVSTILCFGWIETPRIHSDMERLNG